MDSLDIFNQLDTISVAKQLLGMQLHRHVGDTHFVGIITETEAYVVNDEANHAFKGKTKRNIHMFGPPGTLYIYLIYGMYYCLNIVTGKEGSAEAVLIRGIELITPYQKILNGPGKLCRELNITTADSGKMLGRSVDLWIEQRRSIDEKDIVSSPRIGINYAPEPWHSELLRFYIKKR